MSVLIAVASRHEATEKIAEKLGETIHASGFAVDVVRLTDPPKSGCRPDPADYDAVVLGSAVYLGRWLAPARKFLAENKETLTAQPVWTFSSGPIGQNHVGDADAVAVSQISAEIAPIDSRVFGGKLDHDELGWGERALVKLIRAGDEDNRDWDAISTWAEGIAAELVRRGLRGAGAPPRPTVLGRPG